MDFSIVGVGTLSKADITGMPTTTTVNGNTVTNVSISDKAKLDFGAGK